MKPMLSSDLSCRRCRIVITVGNAYPSDWKNSRRICKVCSNDLVKRLRKQRRRAKARLICDICGTDKPGGNSNVMRADHDHDTEVYRGYLCNSCNLGLGALKDSPEILARGLRYLSDHGKALTTEQLTDILGIHLSTNEETRCTP